MIFNFVRYVWGIVFAIFRLFSLSIVLIVNGIHGILFNRTEIMGMTMHGIPMNVERDTMAYLDDLAKSNVDITCGMSLPPQSAFDSAPFRGDDEFEEGDMWIDENGEVIDEYPPTDDTNDEDNGEDKQ